jgi:hypothetical protein
MSSSHPYGCHLRCILSLIVLIANVAAPFRTPTGRSLLRCPRQSDTTRSVARVHVAYQLGSTHGFRAVVGFASGNSGKAAPTLNATRFPNLLPASTVKSQDRLLDLVDTLPRPPLRC